MGRWSPTVVAEGRAPVRSALATALNVGGDVYRDQRDQRQRQEAIDRAQAERDQDLARQQQWHGEDLAQRDLVNKRDAAHSRVDMLEHGWQDTDGPDNDGDELGALRQQAQQTAEPATEGVAPTMAGGPPPDADPRRLAGGSGVGGPDSEAVPRWYNDGKARISAEARARYPGSGTIKQTTPDGQTLYLPVRRQWEDTETAKLDAQLKYEREQSVKARYDKENDDRTAAKDREIEKMRAASALAVAQVRANNAGGGAGSKVSDPVDKAFMEYENTANTDIDNMRQATTADVNRAKAQESMDLTPQAKATMAMADARARGMAIKEAYNSKITQGGRDGFARMLRDQSLSGSVDQLARMPLGPNGETVADLQRDKTIPPEVKAMVLQQYQQQVDKLTQQNRAQPTTRPDPTMAAPRRPVSTLGRALSPGGQ